MRVAVIGGGVLGLATAFYTARREPAAQVEVYETAAQPGGLSTWHDYGRFVWDRFYHCILPGDTALVGFIRDLGLGDQVRWATTRTGFFGEGRIHSVSNTLEFLRFPLLGGLDKLRLAAALAYCARVRDWRRLESVLAEEWLTRLCGRRAWRAVWQPLLRAKYGEAHRRVSAVAIWAAIRRLYSARQPGVGREKLGYVAGGYHAILTRALERLHGAGVKVHLDAGVRRIEPGGAGWRVVAAGGREDFDRVAVTVAPALAARLLPPGAIDAGALDRIEYLGVVCWALVLDRPLTPFYVLNVADEAVPFTGVIEMSNLIAADQTAGLHLAYVPRYVPAADPFYRATDAEVRAAFLPGLRRLVPSLREDWIVHDVVSRAPRVQPLQTPGYSRLLEAAPCRVPGLHVVNTSRLANATLNNDEVVRLAHGLVARMLPGAS